LVLTAALVVLAVMSVFTRGFSGTRALFAPLPVEDPGSLVSIFYSGALNQPTGVPPGLVPFWRGNSHSLSGIAAFSHRPYSSHAQVTPDFFNLLGTRPRLGRLFRPGDRDVAVLSAGTWRGLYGSDPAVLGKRITVGSENYTVAGVLPDSFWAVSQRIAVWTPLEIEPQPAPGVPFLVGAVGRMKHGANAEKVRTDLFRTARDAHFFLPRPPQVTFFATNGRSVLGYLFGIAFALGIGSVMAVREPVRLGRGWRYWGFLTSKTLLVVAIPALAWIEMEGALHPRGELAVALAAIVPTLLFLAGGACALWWSFADQRARCPVCLQRLALPVRLGSWSSVLDPVKTEFLCESGHGSLCIPETESGLGDRWTTLDSSWGDLFR
jgi:hypothetical protein